MRVLTSNLKISGAAEAPSGEPIDRPVQLVDRNDIAQARWQGCRLLFFRQSGINECTCRPFQCLFKQEIVVQCDGNHAAPGSEPSSNVVEEIGAAVESTLPTNQHRYRKNLLGASD